MLKEYFWLLLLLLCPSFYGCKKTEGQLVASLLGDYPNTSARPGSPEKALTVKVGVTIQQISEVNEEKSTMTSDVWFNFEWTDENLRWNLTEWEGIDDIRLKRKQLWIPDIEIYNSIEWEDNKATNLVVSNDGSIIWIPPAKVTTSCKMDLTWFPFDMQNCEMKLGSWTYNGFKLDPQLKTEEADTSTFVLNEDWVLIGAPAKRNEVFYECCPEPYVDLTYSISLQRRSIPYFYNIIIPTFITAFIGILSLLMPAHSCSTARFLVIFFCMFHLIIACSSIKVSNINNSLLGGLLYSFFMLLISLLVFTIFMVRIATTPVSSLHRFSRRIMELILSLARKLCCISPQDYKQKDEQMMCESLSKVLDIFAMPIFIIALVARFKLFILSAPVVY